MKKRGYKCNPSRKEVHVDEMLKNIVSNYNREQLRDLLTYLNRMVMDMNDNSYEISNSEEEDELL